MRRVVAQTSYGNLVFHVEDTGKPAVLMLHGLARNAGKLQHWADELPDFDVCFGSLPGHRAPDLKPTHLAVWIAAFNQAIPAVFPGREVNVIGESLGAIVALGLKADFVLAVEPFLTNPPHFLRELRKLGDQVPPDYAALFHEPRDGLVDRIVSPSLILGGDGAESLLSEEDIHDFLRSPLVSFHRVSGGHALLDDAIPDVRRLFLQGRGERSTDISRQSSRSLHRT